MSPCPACTCSTRRRPFPTGKKPLKLKGETEAHTDADPNKKAPSLMKQVRATERR